MAIANDEIEIIAAFKQGDAKAFAHIFKIHYRPICYFAEKLVGNRQEAEELVSDKFIKLWSKHADFESFSAIKSFLYISTRNGCLDILKHTKRVIASQKEFSYLADNKKDAILYVMFEAELLQELNKEIEKLPRSCRRIFELSYFDNLNSNEVAKKTGFSVKTVYNQKAKAVQLIKIGLLKRNLLVSAFIFSELANNLFSFTEKNSCPKTFTEKNTHFFRNAPGV